MIYQNIELYNVSDLEPLGRENAMKMLRVPAAVRDAMDGDQGRNMCAYNSGAELRFQMISNTVKIRMLCNDPDRMTRHLVYFGGIGAGWQDAVKYVSGQISEITIQKPQNLAKLDAASRALHSGFDPRVVRILLQNTACSIIDIEGEVAPPMPEQTPAKKYLAYGSSITHGSLALNQNETYAYLTADNLGYDLVNFGFAGSARMEPHMADYIASLPEWDTATLEMGINVLDMSAEEYEKRVSYFIRTIAGAHPDKKVFCIDLFYCGAEFDGNPVVAQKREIVRKTVARLALPNTVYINGTTLLSGIHGLSADMVHPNVYGCREIAANLAKIMKQELAIPQNGERNGN